MQVLRVCTVTVSRLFKNGVVVGLCLLAFLLATAVSGSGLFRSLAQSPAQLPGSDQAASQTTVPQAQAAVSGQAAVSPSPVPQPAASTVPSGPQQQIAQLLQMATDLKSEVDKTNKDQLSVDVVRKAGAIEQLAHKVRGAWPAGSR